MSGDARQALAEFRAEGLALTGGGRQDEAYNNALAEVAREALDQSHFGQQSGSEAGRIKLAFAAAADAQSKSEQEAESKAKARFNDAVLLAMLAQLEEEIREHEKELKGLEETLKVKYGDNYVDAIAETYLKPEVLEKLKTKEEKLKALAEQMLDENGDIKAEYASLPEAQYVYHWSSIQKLEKAVELINEGEKLNPDIRPVVERAIGEAGINALDNINIATNKEALSMSDKQADVVSDAKVSAPSSDW